MAVADLLLPGKCSQEAPLEEGTKWRRAPDSLLAASMEPPADAGPARRLTGGYARGRGENLAAGETPEKAFDGQAGSKWLDFGGGGPDSKGSWIEYRLPPGRGAVLAAAVLTSANDCPERDPADVSLEFCVRGKRGSDPRIR